MEQFLQVTVESNRVTAIATLRDWLKNLTSVSKPNTSKAKNNRTMSARLFPALFVKGNWKEF